MQVLVKDQNLSSNLECADNGKNKFINDIRNLLDAVKHKGNISKPNCDKSCDESRVTTYPGISQILPELFLSGAAAAMPQSLDNLGVSFVINVAPELPDTPISTVTKPLYLRINAQDRSEMDLAQYFDDVADMIEEVKESGGKCLVHCVAGVSRSASLCLAYLMKHHLMSLRESYEHIKSIRPQIRPNSGFFQQLRKYEEKLRGTSSVKMVFCESLNKDIPDVLEPEYKAMEDFYRRYRKSLKTR